MQKQKGRVIVVGNAHCGKSALINLFSSNSFPKDYSMTQGAEMVSKITKIENCEKDIQLLFIDTGGHEIYRSMLPQLIQKAQLLMIVFDCTDVESFQSIRYWYDLAIKNNGNNRLPGVLVSTKNDLSTQKVVSMGEAADYAQKMGLDFFETSAVNTIQQSVY